MKKINIESLTVLGIFLISTSYFLFQKYSGLEWDFVAYVLNARYWFDNGFYFEGFRPPLTAFIIGILSIIFSSKITEYVYIFLISLLFVFSCCFLAKKLKINQLLFYSLNTSAFTLILGMQQGTELLFNSLIMLSIAYLINENYNSGFFLSLSALTRYTSLILFPILFLQRSLRKIILSLISFAIPIIPWFIYNYYKYGNFFASIADLYANNVVFRDYMIQKIELKHFLEVQGILSFFFIIGIIIVLIHILKGFSKIIVSKEQIKKKIFKLWDFLLTNKGNILIFIILLLSIKGYTITAIKHSRHLFLLILPTAYFAQIALERIIKKCSIWFLRFKKINFSNITIICAILLFLLNLSIVICAEETGKIQHLKHNYIYEISNTLKNEGLGNCQFFSEIWVFFDYYNISTTALPHRILFDKRMEEGYLTIFTNNNSKNQYLGENATKYNISFSNENFEIIGNINNCKERENIDKLYTQMVDNYVYETTQEHINIEPCFLLFSKNKFAKKVCEIINLD